MIYYYAGFARSFMLMVENLPSSTYDDSAPYRKLAALYSEVLIKVNDWIFTIEKQSFALCITPVCNFIENLLTVIHENIEYLTDIQLCEHCDGAKADIQNI